MTRRDHRGLRVGPPTHGRRAPRRPHRTRLGADGDGNRRWAADPRARGLSISLIALGLAGACGPHSPGSQVDAHVTDAHVADTLASDTPVGPYRHTIAIDGTDDFTAGEMFATTSGSYVARVAWDDQNVYVGYSGDDLDPAAPDTGTKWLFVYLDTDPAGGEAQSQQYNTQRATFPTGFAADIYARYKCDGSLTSLEVASGGTWSTQGTAPTVARGGNFVELAVPRASLGTAQSIGLVTWMINEKALAEGSYAGLYTDNFTDGYAANLPLTRYLRIDFASPAQPNDPANQRP